MDKLKIFIVDDEHLIRNLLKLCVKWGELGMEVAGEASNAREALNLVADIVPDIIFTDICMPFMDGIEFSKIVIERFPHIKVVIVSGHDEFEYAKRSIKLGVSDFLLKPINAEEIKKVALDLKEKIESERTHKKEYEKLKSQLEESLPYPRDKFLNELLDSQWRVNSNKNAKLNFYIKSGLNHKAAELIDELFSEPFYNQNSTIDRIRLEAFDILSACQNVIVELNIATSDIWSYNAQPYEDVSKIDNLPELKEYLKSLISNVIKKVQNSKEKKVNKLIGQIQEHIQRNIHDSGLSLSGVAKEFYISPSYLSRLFKQETTQTFVEYITKMRMERAVEFLKETDLKVYQVGEKIGIADPHYFSIIFKKFTGLSINEFRKI